MITATVFRGHRQNSRHSFFPVLPPKIQVQERILFWQLQLQEFDFFFESKM